MGYRLNLGQSCRWLIIATPGTKLWVEKFATIMKLKEVGEERCSNRWPRAFFFRKHPQKAGDGELANFTISKISADLPGSGWEVHDLQTLRFWSHQTVPDIICEIREEGSEELDIIRMWTSLYGICLPVPGSRALPLHAALIERDGQGVLLVGPGGSGKSTACRRLPHPWNALSDDQSLVVGDSDEKFLAHPFPTWGDYLLRRSKRRWDIQQYARLAAIFFIEQAPSDEVVPIGQERAAVTINHSSINGRRPILWNLSHEEEREFKMKVFEDSCQLARAIPAYILRISLNGQFWEEMEKVL